MERITLSPNSRHHFLIFRLSVLGCVSEAQISAGCYLGYLNSESLQEHQIYIRSAENRSARPIIPSPRCFGRLWLYYFSCSIWESYFFSVCVHFSAM